MRRGIIWSLILLIPVILIMLVRTVISPFIISLIIAYFLNPIVGKLSRLKISRSFSALAIISLFFSLLLTFIFVVAPHLYSQFSNLIRIFPEHLSSLQQSVNFGVLNNAMNIENSDLFIERYSSQIMNIAAKFVNSFWYSTITMLNIISLIFITPVITFYTLRDWPLILQSIDKIIPRKHYQVITEQVTKIDSILSAYIRGQTQVCFLLGIFYATLLYFAGLQYSLFVGFFTGFFSFIPYVGFALGFTVGNVLSFFQFDSWLMRAIIVAIFIVGQILENSIIIPKLIGDNVKLHPIWIIFSIFAGGSVFGFVGVFLSIPIAAIIGVLIRFSMENYFKSNFYETAQFTK